MIARPLAAWNFIIYTFDITTVHAKKAVEVAIL